MLISIRQFRMYMVRKISSIFLLLLPFTAHAQEIRLSENIEIQSSLSQGATPLWLNANRYGLSSLSGCNGYLRAGMDYSRSYDHEEALRLETGVDMVLPYGYKYESVAGEEHYTSHFILQQAYAALFYKYVGLSVGARQQPMELRNAQLSSGAQALGINARPIPQVRLGVEQFWPIPGTGQRIAVKGHAAFGVMTDGEWESMFTNGTKNKYNRLTRYHQKAGYLRVTPKKIPLTVTAGIEMAAQFGGTVYNWSGTYDYSNPDFKLPLKSDLSSYWHAFSSTGRGDTGEGQYKNTEGNQLGSWVLRVDWKGKGWSVGAYADHFFEDHSSMFLLDYDGYGTGESWNKKDRYMFVLYPPLDMQYGIETKLPFQWLDNVVVEFVNSTYQSGPIYHDHNTSTPDHLGGIDNYYNHYSLPGWQHWGQPIGNPFYLAPLYNTDGAIATECNRFRAWHLGAKGGGEVGGKGALAYRLLASYQKGWGTYDNPYVIPRENTSLLVEGTWVPASFPGFTFVAAWGADFGKLRGNNMGVQFTVRYRLDLVTY